MPATRFLAFSVLILAAISSVACQSSNTPQRARAVDVVVRDVDPVLRNTIGAQASIRNLEPRLVAGYGLVVGLNGTGSNDAPSAVRAALERDMRRRGVGEPNSEFFANITPSQLIESPDTAVVIVSAVIPAGLPEGEDFDVSVSTLPGSSTSSLRGGRLYTTELRPGLARVAGPDVAAIAEARGEVFINPFAGRDDANLERPTDGRVLGGGTVIDEQPIVLLLDNASHARGREMVASINSRFPLSTLQREPTATGLSDEQIELRIPPEHRSDIGGFLRIVLGLRVDQSYKADWAARYARELVEQPSIAQDLTFALVALGPVASEFIRPLYDHPDPAPRAAALTAGSILGDLITRDYIIDLAEGSTPNQRAAYIGLLRPLPDDGRITRYLSKTLNDPDPSARVAAYEVLRDRGDPLIRRIPADFFDGKFALHIVPSEVPMLYVRLQGRPTIALFKRDTPLESGTFASAWGGDLMFDMDENSTDARVWVRDERTGDSYWSEVEPQVTELIKFLANDLEADRPGVDLSYSETVSALAEFVDAGVIDARFFTEQDRLALALLRAVSDIDVEQRPELAGETLADMTDISDQAQVEEIQRRATSTGAEQAEFDFSQTIVRPAPPPGR